MNTTNLTKEEETALFILYRERGNVKAREKLITKNMRYVWYEALKHKYGPIPVKDLVGDGSIGLLQALELFDYKRGLKFLTYGKWNIQRHINDSLRDRGSLIRIPANQYEKIRQARKKIQTGNGGYSNEIKELLWITNGGIPLDAKVPNSGGSTLNTYSDIIPDNKSWPDVTIEEKRLKNLFSKLLTLLEDETEKEILELLFGMNKTKPLTIKEVGKMYSISPARVKQYRDQAIRKIRNKSNLVELKEKYDTLLELY